MKRRWAAFAAAHVMLLAGCSSSDNNNIWGEYLQILKDSAAGTFGDRAVTREQAAAVPYATMGYRLNGGQQMMLILATDANDEQLWTSSARIVFQTQDGRIKLLTTLKLLHLRQLG